MKMDANASPFKIILGSSSVARRKILAEMGYEFTIVTADIDEKAIRKDTPEELVMALAEAKADAIISKLQYTDNQEMDGKPTVLIVADTEGKMFLKLWYTGDIQDLVIALLDKAEAIVSKLPIGDYRNNTSPTLLITSDQVVVYEGVVREKPSSKEEALEFIKGYSGRQAATVGSVLVTNLKTGVKKGNWDKVEIFFKEIPDETINNLIEEGIVLNVAGGLIIEHPLIFPFIKEVVGTTDSVMGLPKALTESLLKEVI